MDRTNTERQRRYIARLKAQAAKAPAAPDIAALARDLAQATKGLRARARIVELAAGQGVDPVTFTAKDIAATIVGMFTVSQAEAIAREMLALLKQRANPIGT